MSDFSKIDFLEMIIKERADIAIKKFCHHRLAALYLDRGMNSKAAQNMEALARVAATYDEKIKAYMDSVKILVSGGELIEAERVLDKALGFSSYPAKRVELKKELIKLYKDKAIDLEKNMKRAAALSVYERIHKLGDEIDKEEAKKKLLYYYEKLGKIKDYNRLQGIY